MRLWTMVGVSALLISCDNGDKSTQDTQVGTDTQAQDTYDIPTDADGDGYAAEDDCDDANPDIRPGREEDCNGIDDNCNGVIDEGFSDTDGDATPDCIDVEECDGVDNDGDGLIDEDFADSDGDGVADCVGIEDCNGIDDDGDGTIDEGFDADGDGYTSCGDDKTPADCNDKDASINPGVEETDDDDIDNDCDGVVDEGDWRIGDLFITEVMVNPAAVGDPDGEWFEVKNTSGRDIDLSGMVISSTADGDTHQITADKPVIVANGEFAILAANGDTSTNGGVENIYAYGEDISMSNESDDLCISVDGMTIDCVEWDDGVNYPDPSGASITVDPDYFSSSLNDLPEAWCQAIRAWDDRSDLGYPNTNNFMCRPIADASIDTSTTLYNCTDLELDGSASEGVPGTPLYYAWELVSAPSNSNLTSADIVNADQALASIMPDAYGSYTFSLTTYNGYEYSAPSSVTITVEERLTNSDPVADAGPDEAYSEASVCWPVSYGSYYTCNDCGDQEFELDGTGTTDADGDWVAYSWAITAGNSYASIVDDDTATPVVTVSGVGTTYGNSNTVAVEVTLTTTDCMGATSEDIVNLSYTCDGT